MEIRYGARVLDSNGRSLGRVERVEQDTYTGEIRGIRVGAGSQCRGLFFAPRDITKVKADEITVNITDEAQPDEEQYGATVEDCSGRLLGSVDFIVRDTFTGKVKKLKASKSQLGTEIFFSPQDVLETRSDKVILRNGFDEQTWQE